MHAAPQQQRRELLCRAYLVPHVSPTHSQACPYLYQPAFPLAPRLQVIALKKVPQKPRNDKPLRIPIPHPIHTAEGAEVCLFVKDHKGALRVASSFSHAHGSAPAAAVAPAQRQ